MIFKKTVLKRSAAFSHPASADMLVDQHSSGQSILLHLLPRLSRVVLLVPMACLVWWRRNIYIGIIAHCLLNLIGTIVLFAQLLG
jgi:hypothetical protein